jgi:hypothetical protein
VGREWFSESGPGSSPKAAISYFSGTEKATEFLDGLNASGNKNIFRGRHCELN